MIVIRTDLKMSKGKMAAQAAHAAVSAAEKADKKILASWKKEGQKKVVLKVPDLEALIKVKEACDIVKVKYSVIADAGRTELETGTITCIGIGPDREDKINKITGSLALLN